MDIGNLEKGPTRRSTNAFVDVWCGTKSAGPRTNVKAQADRVRPLAHDGTQNCLDDGRTYVPGLVVQIPRRVHTILILGEDALSHASIENGATSCGPRSWRTHDSKMNSLWAGTSAGRARTGHAGIPLAIRIPRLAADSSPIQVVN